PPLHGEDAVLEHAAVGVGEEERARLGVLADADVGLGHADADPVGTGTGVGGDLAAGLVQDVVDLGRLGQRLGLGAAARVPVHVDEVDVRPGDRQHGLVPRAAVAGADEPVGPVRGGGQHRADLDRRVDRLHRLRVGHDALGVGAGTL